MKIAYLIPVHANPRHLARLIDRLAYDENRCFVHIDAKSDLQQFNILAARPVDVLPARFAVHWADFSIVEATLALLAAAMAHPARFDYFTLISGADYPVQSSRYIQDFFSHHAGTEFIDIVQMPAPETYGKHISRLTLYYHRPDEPRTPQPERDYQAVFGDLVPFAGSQWWSLTRESCEEILRFGETYPDIFAFYANSRCPDEGFFQTVIGNLAGSRPIRRNLVYTDWRKGGASPAEISEEHLDFLGAQRVQFKDAFGEGEILFARKFSDNRSEIVDRLDGLIRKKNAAFDRDLSPAPGDFVPQPGWQTNPNKLVLVAVGGTAALHQKLYGNAWRISPVLFEPNPAAAASLRNNFSREFPDVVVNEFFLSDISGPQKQYVARYGGCSSPLEPNTDVLDRYRIGGIFHVVGTETISGIRYDTLFDDGLAPVPDVLHVSGRGYDYEVLQGFGAILQDVLCIEMRTHLYPLYKDQKLLHDLTAFLAEFGFVLRALQPVPTFDGDIVELDACFTKNIATWRGFDLPRKSKFSMICDLFNLLDYRRVNPGLHHDQYDPL